MKWKWLVPVLPGILAVVFSIVLNLGLWQNPSIFVRTTLGNWILLLGVLLTVFTASGYAMRVWSDRYQHIVMQLASEERRRFLRRLDHELKNPLTAIRAGLANLVEAPTSEARQDAYESIQSQAVRLSQLSADLRKLAELEIRPLERSPVDVGPLLEEVFAMAQELPGAEGKRFSLSIPRAPWPLPRISGDQDLLFLAIHNLLDNAIKFTQQDNTIEVRAYEDGAYIVIEVADTGPGIPDEDLPHVWEELYRGKSARGTSGSGLGLALVRAISERHGGQVNLRSRHGQGTVVSLRLPTG